MKRRPFRYRFWNRTHCDKSPSVWMLCNCKARIHHPEGSVARQEAVGNYRIMGPLGPRHIKVGISRILKLSIHRPVALMYLANGHSFLPLFVQASVRSVFFPPPYVQSTAHRIMPDNFAPTIQPLRYQYFYNTMQAKTRHILPQHHASHPE